MKATAALIAAIVVLPALGQGPTVLVRVDPFFQPGDGRDELVLIVERMEAEGQGPVEVAIATAGSTTVSVPSAGRWNLTCRSEQLWCPRLAIDTDELEAGYLPVFEKVRLHGWLDEAQAKDLPRTVAVQGWLRLTARGEPIASFSYQVPVDDAGRFDLDAPAGALDLRLAAVGTAPAYRWGFEAQPPATELGRFQLLPGGSVAGFAVDGSDGQPISGIEVAAEPSGSEPTHGQDRLQRARSRARTNQNGFFQITGLFPGEYRLVLSGPGFAKRVAGPAEIAAESETLLEHAIELDQPVTLGIQVDPPQTPSGDAWTLELASDRPITIVTVPERKRAGEDGVAVFDTLDPGHYRIRVLDEDHGRLLDQRVQVDADRLVELRVPLVEVIGHVHLNGKPLGARLELSAGDRDQTILYSDNESGAIEGWMRTPSLSLLHVEVQAEDPPVQRSFILRDPTVRDQTLELEIELEGIDVSGVVVDAKGKPIAGATIESTVGTGDRAGTLSDGDGAFTLYALAPGARTVEARHARHGRSGPVALELVDDRTPPAVRLVLNPREDLHGRLVTAAGSPVPGAAIGVLTVGPAPEWARQATRLDGTFTVAIPEGATHGVFAVSAPGHVLWSACEAIEADLPSVLRLPPTPGGELRLTLPPDDPQEPVRGSHALLSSNGGMLDLNTLHNWSRAMGTGGAAVDASGTTSLVVPRIAADRGYALIRATDFNALARQICLAGPPAHLDWRYLPAAGEVSIGSDSGAR